MQIRFLFISISILCSLFHVHSLPHLSKITLQSREIITLPQMSCVWCLLEVSWLLCGSLGSCEEQICGTASLRRVRRTPCSMPSCRPPHAGRLSGPSRSCVKSWSCILAVSHSSTTPWGADCTTGRPKHYGPNWIKEPARESTWEAMLAPAPRYKESPAVHCRKRVVFTSCTDSCFTRRFLLCVQCLIIGAGPCGLRTAIELRFSGRQGGSGGKARCFLTEQCSSSLAPSPSRTSVVWGPKSSTGSYVLGP